METTPGTGRNPGVDHHGGMSRIQSSQLQRRPTSCRMSMSSISNERSRVWSPSRTGQISPLSFGETCWQTDKLTSQPWLKIISRESPPMMKSSTLAITLSSQRKGPGNLNLRSLPTRTGSMLGRNIQQRFSGHTHIGGMSSTTMGSISLDNSWRVEYDQAAQKFFHGHQELSFADTSQLANLANQIFMPRKPRGAAWGGDSNLASTSQGGGRRKNKRKRGGSTSEFPICREFNKATGCKRLDCCFVHKCSNCLSSSHSESRCTCKAKEGTRE